MFILLQLSLLFLQVQGLPSGAPAQACSAIYPVGHGGSSQGLQNNPFSLDMAVFDELGGTIYYVPEATYEVCLSGSGAQFRGFLVQARSVADESPVGSFTASGTGQRLSSCTTPESAVTHNDRTDKMAVTMMWTAPADGQLQFLFAVVQRYSPGMSLNTFWATAESAILHPCQFPVYVSGGQCVQSCPDSEFGNHETQQCEPYESFRVSTNATEYYTAFQNDIDLGTPVLNFSVVLNHTYWNSPVDRVYVGLEGDSTVTGILGLRSDGASTDSIESISLSDSNTAVAFSIYYSATPPQSVTYPYNFNFSMDIRVIGLALGTFLITAVAGSASGRITLPPEIDPCIESQCANGATCAATNNQTFTCICVSGYTGTFCDVDIDDCESTSCLNGGTCFDEIAGFNCACQPQYTGPRCNSTLTSPPCDCNPCSNNGSCVEDQDSSFFCSCLSGYTGTYCEEDIDDCLENDCVNGTCVDGVASYHCECDPGYTGSLNCSEINECDTADCNNGTCTDLVNDYMCNCFQDYTGENCNVEINDCANSPCNVLNSVSCVDGNSTYTCTCFAGFTGQNCSEEVNGCIPVPCANGGTCISMTGGAFTCVCPPEWTGETCSIDVLPCDPNPCANGGTCTQSGTDFTCECAVGWTGTECTEDIDECSSSTNPCQNGGTCTNVDGSFDCECASGFMGDSCGQDDPNVLFCVDDTCSNGGTCNEAFGTQTTCTCTQGYAGDSCDDDDQNIIFCNDGSCDNGGTCIEEFGPATSCQCAQGYAGSDCSEDDPNEIFCEQDSCANGGTCNEGFGTVTTCTCASGFMGDSCGQDDPNVLFCEDDTCSNGGTCEEDFGDSTTCICTVGFSGATCEITLFFCSSDTCMNDGTCIDGEGSGIMCACPSGFTGMLCEIDIDNFCLLVTCENGGTCIEGVGDATSCDCHSGFTGDFCTEDDTTVTFCQAESCANGGTCNEDFGDSISCTCASGYTGDTCNYDDSSITFCTSSSCLNGGTCYETSGQEVVCGCLPNFTGTQCEIALCLTEEDIPVYPGSNIVYSWTQTEAGTIQTQTCPEICRDFIDYPPGTAVVRTCLQSGSTAEWEDADISPCGLNIAAVELCEASQLESNVEVIAAVANITANASALESSALTVSGDIIEDLTDAAIEDPEVRGNYLTVIDNVLEADPDELLESQEQSKSSTKILQGLNRFLDLIPINNETGNVTFTLNNFGIIALETSSLDQTEPGQAFSADLGPVTNAVSSSEAIVTDQLLVTSKPISNVTGSISLQNLSSCVGSGSQRIAYSVFRTDALFLTPDTACTRFTVGSIILGVRVNDIRGCNTTSVTVDMQQLEQVCIEMLAPGANLRPGLQNEASGVELSVEQESICSNYAEDETSGVGRWSSDNCKRVSSKGGRTVCDCSQLGHFGLLFDLNPGESLSPLALAIISYIGAILSVVCLAIVVLTYSFSKRLRRSEHGKILINLSVSLICLYVVFVIAGLVTSVEALCGLVSALFQYFMLVFFGWTAAEAVILYYKLVKVLGKPIEHFVLKAVLIIWLVPILIVGVSVGPGYKYYINPYYCRATEWPFWFGLILPFSVIYAFNWTIFTIIMMKLLGRRNVAKVDIKNKNTVNIIKQNLIIAVGLSLLFGLGWGFGLTATSSDVKEVTFAFQVIFSVFVGSQGVLIFFFHGVRSPEFRQVWVSVFGLRKQRKTFSPSSNYLKKQPGRGSSATYNASTLNATGTLPSDFTSKAQFGTLKRQLDSAEYFSSIESEPGISTFEMSTVVANQVEVAETEMEENTRHSQVTEKDSSENNPTADDP